MIGLARLLLSILLPRDVRGAMLAELDAEYARVVRPSKSALAAHAWYWRQVWGSLAPALAMRRRRARWTADLAQDLRFAIRLLGRQKGFTAAVVATLAIGIGATTAIFSIVDGVILRPLPFGAPASLVRVWAANPRGIPRNGIAPPDFFDWRDRARAFSHLAAFGATDVTLTGAGDPVQLAAATATADLADTLGVAPLLGRWFVAAETRGAGEPVVVLGERLWRERFGAAADICGRTVLLDARPRVVIGIMPRAFAFPSGAELAWLPLPDSWRAQPRSAHFLGAVGRLKPGMTLDAGRDDLRTVARALEGEYPDSNRGWGVTIVSLQDAIVGDVRTPLLVLLAAVASVLLIACANVASLLLARGVARSRELAVRAAVGASTARLARQQLVEALVLSLLGGAAGLTLAAWALGVIRSTHGVAVPMLDRVSLDARVVLVTLAISVLCAIVTGVLPAWRAARLPRADILNGGTRNTGGHVGVRQAIVFAQVAIATALVIAGLLLVRSFDRLTAVPAGFNADRTLLADLSLPSVRYKADARSPFYDRALDAVRALPGVQVAGAGGPLPLSGQDGLLRFGVTVERPVTPAAQSDRAYLRWATPGYFEAMGIHLRSGRPFGSADTPTSMPVAVIDDELARRFFAGEDPIGRRVRVSIERTTWRTVIGVVGAVRQTSLDRSAEPHVYLPQAQVPTPALTLVVRGAMDPAAAARGVREAIRALDADLPVSNVRSLADLVAGSTASRALSARLVSLFAASALLLTIVGVYGVVSQIVAQSARELGVRIALGATGMGVVGLTLQRALRMAVAGVATGCALAWIAAPALAGMVYGIAPRDPATLATAAALLIVAAALAAYIPARRILRIDVLTVLRVD